MAKKDIRAELLAVTKITPKAGEDEGELGARVAHAIDDNDNISGEVYDALSPGVKAWYTKAAPLVQDDLPVFLPPAMNGAAPVKAAKKKAKAAPKKAKPVKAEPTKDVIASVEPTKDVIASVEAKVAPKKVAPKKAAKKAAKKVAPKKVAPKKAAKKAAKKVAPKKAAKKGGAAASVPEARPGLSKPEGAVAKMHSFFDKKKEALKSGKITRRNVLDELSKRGFSEKTAATQYWVWTNQNQMARGQLAH